MPSAFAVLKLMTNLKFVGLDDGKIDRLLAFEDTVDVASLLTEYLRDVHAP